MSRKSKNLLKKSWFLLLAIFFLSCKTGLVAKYPAVEAKPTLKVSFVPITKESDFGSMVDNGFFLSFTEYQNLAVNVEQYRQHIKKLEQVIAYYEALCTNKESPK